MADLADECQRKVDEMPEWARECAIDTRIPVSAKVEHDGLEVKSWKSKRGIEMHLVRWADGTATEDTGDLSTKYIQWDR